jgi:2-oxoglutarate ferredoxin oxidoreductase subunit alpha
MQARWGRHGDAPVIALCPASVGECFRLTVQAFNLAERFRTPVVVLADEIVAHMRENLRLPAPGAVPVVDRLPPSGDPASYLPFAFGGGDVAPLAAYGSEYIFHITSSMHGPDGRSNNSPENAARRVAHLHAKLERHRDAIVMTRCYDTDDAEVLIVALGITTRAARAAALEARQLGERVGVLQLQTVWPFPTSEVAALGRRARLVVVAEMNHAGQVRGEVTKAIGPGADIRGVNSCNGAAITPEQILAAIAGPKMEAAP